jgi:hypothetical protein
MSGSLQSEFETLLARIEEVRKQFSPPIDAAQESRAPPDATCDGEKIAVCEAPH